MTCTRYPDDDVVVRYVTGDLAEPELSTFEDHMFACDACLARVERYQHAQEALGSRDLPPVTTAVPSATDAARTSAPQVRWWVVGAMAAAVLAVLSGVLFLARRPAAPAVMASSTPAPIAPVRPSSPPAPETIPSSSRSSGALRVAVLAMVTPPPYLPLTTRGERAEDNAFRDGMVAYTRADWSAAARELRRVDSPQARFYLGVADLMRGDAVAAAAAFEAARASGRLPYARESLFYLGKSALQRGDVATARQLFVAARDAGAGPGGEAARLVRALDELEQ